MNVRLEAVFGGTERGGSKELQQQNERREEKSVEVRSLKQ